ncbi:MAG: APC family permease [Acidiferrobacterales bacterium]
MSENRTIMQTQSGEPADDSGNRLRGGRLSFMEVLGHAVANITPSAMAAVTVSLVVANAGALAWLVYLVVGGLMMLVAGQVARLAQHVPAAGSLFVYLSRALHPVAGIVAGWAMVGGYLGALLAAPVLGGVFAAKAFAFLHISLPAWAIGLALAAIAWSLAVRDVELAARYGLIVEGFSIACIVAIGVVALVRHGFVDPAQLDVSHVDRHGFFLACMLTVLAYGGFETAGNLAREQRGSEKTVPRAILVSVAVVGVFFVFMAYAEVLGFGDNTVLLGRTTAPLNLIAARNGVPWLAVFSDLAMAAAAFSACVATLNSISRILYSMARHGVLPHFLARVHPQHHTPTPALHLLGVAMIAFVSFMAVSHVSVLAAVNLFGIFTAMGFLVIYSLACVAAPRYLWRLMGRPPLASLLASLLGLPMLLYVLWGNLYPFPSSSQGVVTGLFLAYLLSGVIVFVWIHRCYPQRVAALVQGLAGD